MSYYYSDSAVSAVPEGILASRQLEEWQAAGLGAPFKGPLYVFVSCGTDNPRTVSGVRSVPDGISTTMTSTVDLPTCRGFQGSGISIDVPRFTHSLDDVSFRVIDARHGSPHQIPTRGRHLTDIADALRRIALALQYAAHHEEHDASAEDALKVLVQQDVDAVLGSIAKMLDDPLQDSEALAELLVGLARAATERAHDGLVAVLQIALCHRQPYVRDAAGIALVESGATSAISMLERRMLDETNPVIRRGFQRALEALR